jgi:hypothetical protein
LPSRKASSSRLSASRTPSGTRPARQHGPVWRILRLGAGACLIRCGVRACRQGATSTAAIAAPVPMPPVATSRMATRARTNCSSDHQRRLGVAPGSRFAPTHRANQSGKSLATSGCRPSGRTTGRARTPPELLVCGGAPRRNRTGDPILTIDAPGVHNALRHLRSPHICPGEKRCRGSCRGAGRGCMGRSFWQISGTASAGVTGRERLREVRLSSSRGHQHLGRDPGARRRSG